MRKTPLVTNNIYHVFNRGVNKNDIFFLREDYPRFLMAAKHYIKKVSKFSYEKSSSLNDPVSLELKPKVEILAYCLMPNHFHFLMKQVSDSGITSFMRHFMNSYVHFTNVKYKRVGPLFQGRFKNVLIESDEQLLHVSRYIHLNPLVSGLVNNLNDYPWSSYLNYVEAEEDELSSSKQILGYFKNRKDYVDFVSDQEDYARSLEQLKHMENF